jgi:hypothetical protein
VQTFFRTTTTDVRIGGTVVPEDHKVLMFLPAAKPDPAGEPTATASNPT